MNKIGSVKTQFEGGETQSPATFCLIMYLLRMLLFSNIDFFIASPTIAMGEFKSKLLYHIISLSVNLDLIHQSL